MTDNRNFRAVLKSKLKFLGGAEHYVTGIASTASLDAHGHVLHPEGAKWDALPLELLREHNRDQPLGHVVELKATKAGLRFKARIDSADAWADMQAGCLRGVSVSSKPIDFDRIDGKMIWNEWKIFEISLCEVPANGDARIDGYEFVPAPGVDKVVEKATKPAEIPEYSSKGLMGALHPEQIERLHALAREQIRAIFNEEQKENPKPVQYTQGVHDGILGALDLALGLALEGTKASQVRLDQLQQRVAELEAGIVVGNQYRGVYQRVQAYNAGDLVTCDGGMWHANSYAPAGIEPGKNPSVWQLCAKSSEAPLSQRDTAGKRIASGEPRAKQKIEITTVTKHDSAGRVLEMRKQVVEE
ncbi:MULTISPECIES: HK97 family phage prohead protease [unclassified Mesorhizobium]|uniref:HK97 family phage prohead protease n=1 Tax=unclassified Mesorhizobium TaxID=325217 RepID=UPI000FD9A0A6|nr:MULTISPECIES: HK97 family phage prohead protease [unclassified Mesorhizobium]TGQ09005.1 hypothetical protein EN862_022500 [Mesorhizobium sp. M2E.F.Ca.ET.219.01.1.1]TGT69540.1 hypothetical protein EN809_024780 [Mesorhizobium sp. M2E.F.Ca.ET.166.01.1.1]TGW01871.1 hypothetical protein EN797_016270 [Mesorhizobium sp. M2E.F.Ca.ET.154.01.1.1]